MIRYCEVGDVAATASQEAKRYNLRSWPSLYRFAEEAQVNISNLTTRLRRLGLIHSIDGQKRTYLSDDEVTGQSSLF